MFATQNHRRLAGNLTRAAAYVLFAAAAPGLCDTTVRSALSTPAGFALSRKEAAAAVQLGLAAARDGKPAESLVADVRREPVWTGIKHGPARDCSVWFTSISGADLRLRALRAGCENSAAEATKLLPRESAVVGSLDFDVLLRSVPRTAKTAWHQDPTADVADVRVERFEISDDCGSTLILRPGACADFVAEGVADVMAGAPIAGERNNRRDIVRHTAAALEFSGASEKPFYQARYHVHATLWDKEGRLRISPEAREVRLTIVTKTGRMSTTYTLPTSSVSPDLAQVARAESTKTQAPR